MNNYFRKNLKAGIKKLSLPDEYLLSEDKIDALLAYHQLLIKWNKAYNLTAVRDPQQMISRHLLDSLAIAPYLKGQRFIDIGTGAGLPGIVLSILFADRQFDLLDSNGKKTRFLFQVKTELCLSNITIHNCRVEQHKPELAYDGVISRALATLANMVSASWYLLSNQGSFYAMKGVYPEDEIKQLKKLSVLGKNYKVEVCHSLQVPDQEGQRHLVVIGPYN
ncbi:MAG: 16S rRNA (guanine(527)-N(7))-methyltransferase RsmG [Pseudomonadales bacterium]